MCLGILAMIRPAPLLSHLVPLPIPLPRVETFDWQSAEAMASLAAVSKFRLVMLSSKADTFLSIVLLCNLTILLAMPSQTIAQRDGLEDLLHDRVLAGAAIERILADAIGHPEWAVERGDVAANGR